MANWNGILAVEGVPTGDGRIFEAGSLRWEDLPIALRFVREDNGGHDGAVSTGTITEIVRDGSLIRGAGTFDEESEEGQLAERLVAEQIQDGVSVDLDEMSFEVRVSAELLEEEQADSPVDADGRVKVAEFAPDDELMVVSDALIRTATLVAIPAFKQARITIGDEVLTASVAGPPPSGWFSDPKLEKATALTITNDGRVYGHLATWDVCHIGMPAGTDVCVTAPPSAHEYAYFNTGAVETDGGEVTAGRITMGTGHAGPRLQHDKAAAHYDNTGTVVADVHAGEDEYGIWVAGALRPGVSEEKLRALKSAPLSGDWRNIDGELELVAALAVNVPGFPIPRTSGMVAAGTMQSLVAAGLVDEVDEPSGLTKKDMAWLKQLADREKAHTVSQYRDVVTDIRTQRARREVQNYVNRR